MQRRYPVPGFRDVSLRHSYQFTVMRLVSNTAVRITPHEVARALTTTRLANDELLIQR